MYPFLRLLWPLVGGIVCAVSFCLQLPAWSLWGCGVLALAGWLAYRYAALAWLCDGLLACAFFGCGLFLAGREWGRTDCTFPAEKVYAHVRLEERPVAKEYGYACRVVTCPSEGLEAYQALTGGIGLRLCFGADSLLPALEMGDELLIYARVEAWAGEAARYWRLQGVAGSAWVNAGEWRQMERTAPAGWMQTLRRARDRQMERYRRLGFSDDVLAVLAALTLGEREELDDELRENYSVAGAAHVLALSGLHVGLLTALLWVLFTPLCRWWRASRPLVSVVIALMLWLYALFTGASPSVVRAVVMSSIWLFSSWQYERPVSLNTWAAAAFLMLLVRPLWLFDVGFQLSFAAVAALVLFHPRLYGCWKPRWRLLRYLWSLLSLTLVAQLGTLPLILFYFSRFPTHFLLTGLWVVPWVSVVLYAAVLLLLFTPFPTLQMAWASVVEWLIACQNRGVQWVGGLPYASVDGGSWDVWEVLLLYLCLGACVAFLLRPVYGRLRWVLCLSGLLLAYQGWAEWRDVPRQSLLLYEQRRSPVVHLLMGGGRSYLFASDSCPDTALLRQKWKKPWKRWRLDDPVPVCGESETESWLWKEGILSWQGRHVCMLTDNRWQAKRNRRPLPLLCLYVTDGYKGGLQELDSLFRPERVVLDASLPAYRQQRLAEECLRRGVACHTLRRKGSFRISWEDK